MNLQTTIQGFWQILPTYIKEEYLENLAVFYNYTPEIEEQKLREIETWEILENWEKEKRIEYFVEKIKNPVKRNDFLAEKIASDFIINIQEKIKIGWEIKLENQIKKDTEKLFS